ncbi:ABC transporter permease [Phycicoccus endophyticus]|uniref:Transport permease protein n=1 Tax=Phycicoccus endophyticus TaxID=1690220 RepID=A0A7G9R3S8_9MICO|nr:ABC transporter permease [Phycicoccus endophyticus]NHI18077.1 ABC transporter permease [Phycicoccus endophyticus]QNN50253.1 ABC transporter permease [Phycicoccus endophyticus]GGL26639.1 transport permease protein [Phycicoccus endophyticus]
MRADATQTAPPSGRLQPGPRPAMRLGERVRAATGHHLRVYRRTWRGSVISRFLSPLFFLAAMGLGLGALVDAGSGGVGQQSYLQFVVPGIVAYQAALLGFGDATYPVLGYIKWNRMYAATLATPLGVTDILLGHLSVLAANLAVATAIFVGVSALFGAFASWWVLLAVPVGLLTGLAFAVPTFAISATIETDNVFGILYRFVLTPVLLFSGTFFPLEQLPGWLRPMAWLTPLGHGVVLTRDAALGRWPGPVALVHLLVIVVVIAVGWVLAHRQLTRRLLS